MLFDHETTSNIINAVVAGSIAYIGRQFHKNRNAGFQRDRLVEALSSEISILKTEVQSLTREVDRDRSETRFTQEAIRSLEREVWRLWRSEEPTNPNIRKPPL